MSLTMRLAQFALGVRLDSLSANIVENAHIRVLDTIGVTLAGLPEKAPRLATELALETAPTGPSTLVGSGLKTSVQQAAFVNGIAAHALEIDDMSTSTTSHTSATVLPAMLALAESKNFSGKQFLEAYIAGFEVTTRIGWSMGFNLLKHGWHPNGVLSVIGTAALYGLEGQLASLPSERDQIFRIKSKGGDEHLLRISGAGESLQALEFQNGALRHIEAVDSTLPVPRLRKSRYGNDVEVKKVGDARHGFRVLSYLPGVPIHGRQSSPALRDSVGSSLARLDRALEELTPPAISCPLLWDLKKAGLVRPMIRYVEGGQVRSALEVVFARLQDILPRLEALNSQVIHNDFNRKNVLFQPTNAGVVSGIIDFGDMTTGPRTVDLGVAIARHIDRDNAVDAACEILTGYLSVSRLSDEELQSLYWLICARLALRAVIWSWRRAKGDSRSDPGEISSALDLLEILQTQGETKMVSVFGSI